MRQDVIFNHENPKTVHDVLWSWSEGYLTSRQAVESLHLDDELELYETANDNDVPIPGAPSARDIELADEFVRAISEF